MKTANIAIFERNEEFLSELRNYFDAATAFNVCASAATGDAALESLKTVSPDAAIIDTALKGIDGIKLLDYIKSLRPECVSFVMSEFDDNRIVNSAINHGAIYYFVKPVTPQVIAERITDILSEKTTDYKVSAEIRDKRRTASIDEKISNIFITVGIPAHIKGYQYLREAIKMTIDSPEIINYITKKLYPEVAEHFNTSPSKVERAIRHAIEVAWNRGKIENINTLFGVRVYNHNEKPTNGEFIALVADKMLLESV